MIKKGTQPDHALEVWFECPDKDEAIVGLGLRVGDDDLTTLHAYTRKLDHTTGKLLNLQTRKAGSIPNHELEVSGSPATELEKTLLQGVGIRMGGDDITTLVNYYGKVEMR